MSLIGSSTQTALCNLIGRIRSHGQTSLILQLKKKMDN